jgi:hypothetical protein
MNTTEDTLSVFLYVKLEIKPDTNLNEMISEMNYSFEFEDKILDAEILDYRLKDG